MNSLALTTWFEVANTKIETAQASYASPGGQKQYITSYSGGAVRNSGSELFVFGGGHNDYAGNEVVSLRLQNDVPAWVLRRAPTATIQTGVSHYSDGRPASRHTYWNPQFIEARGRFMLFAGGTYDPTGGVVHNKVDAFRVADNDWDAANTFADAPGIYDNGQCVCKDASENVWMQQNGSSGTLARWNQATATWTTIGSRSVHNINAPMAFDSTRNRLVRFDDSFAARFDLSNNAAEAGVTFSGANASAAGNGTSVVYVPDLDAFLFMPWGSSTIYRCDAATFSVSVFAVSGTPPPGSAADGTGQLFGRFNIMPELKLIIYVRSVSDNAWVFRYGAL